MVEPTTDRDNPIISPRKVFFPIILILTISGGLVTQISLDRLETKQAIAATVDDARLDRPVPIELGSKAIYRAENLEITVVSICDGRCPKNVN